MISPHVENRSGTIKTFEVAAEVTLMARQRLSSRLRPARRLLLLRYMPRYARRKAFCYSPGADWR